MAENVGGIVWTAEMKTELLISAQKIVESSMAATGTAFERAAKKSEEASKTIASSSKAAGEAVKASSSEIQAAQQSLATATKALSDRYTSAQSKLKEFVTQQVAAGRSLDENGNVTTSAGVRAAKLSEEYNKLRVEFQAASKQVDSVNNVIQKLARTTEELKTETATANPPVKELATAIKLQEAAADTLANQYTQSAKNLNEFIAAQIKAGGSISQTGKVLDAAGDEVTDMTAKLDRLAAEYAQNKTQVDAVNATFMRQTRTANAVGGALGGIGRNAGQAGIQIQQFIGQVQGGQSVMLALSQQSADLGIVLGAPLLGAIIGISASVGGMLFNALTAGGDKVEDLTDKIKALRDEAGLTANQAKFLSREEMDSLQSKYARIEAIKLENFETEKLIKTMSEAGAGLEKVTPLSIVGGVPRSADDNLQRYAEKLDVAQRLVEKNKAEMDLLAGEIERSKENIDEYAKGVAAAADQQKRIADFTKDLSDQAAVATEKMQNGDNAARRLAIALQLGLTNAEMLPAPIEKAVSALEKAEAESQKIAKQNQALESAARSWDNLSESIAKQSATAESAAAANQYQIQQIQMAGEAAGKTAEEIQKLVDAQNALFSAQQKNKKDKEEEKQDSKVEELEKEIQLQQIRNSLGNDQFEIQSAINALGKDATPEDQQKIAALITQMQALRYEADLLGPSLNESFGDVALGAMDQFSQGMAGVLMQTQGLREMVGNLAGTIASELLTAIIRFYVGQAAAALVSQATVTTASTANMAATAVASTTTTAATAATNTTLVGGMATVVSGIAATLAGAWAPAAFFASTATLGGAAGIGVSSLATGMAATLAIQAVGGLVSNAIGAATAFSPGGTLNQGPGRLNGGPVYPGMMHPVTEDGNPELYTMQGQSFLLPGSRGGEVTSFKDMQKMGAGGSGSGGTGAPVINFYGMQSKPSVQSRFSEADRKWVIDVGKSELQSGKSWHKEITTNTSSVNRTR